MLGLLKGAGNQVVGDAKYVAGVGGSQPQYEQVQLDPGTQALMEQRRAHAMKSDGDIANEMTAGIERGGEQLRSDTDMSLGQASLGMQDDPALRAALGKRQSRGFERATNQVKRQAMQEAPIERFNRISGLTGQAAQQNQVKFEQFQRAKAFEANKKAARNQVISSVLGAGGMAAGAIAGGPQGAAAGGQAASSLGGNTQTQQMG